MSSKPGKLFDSLAESTAFKRSLNRHTVAGYGFCDLNAHTVDAFLVQRTVTVERGYGWRSAAWLFSKLFGNAPRYTGAPLLLAPAEPDKDRSIGLFRPLMNILPAGHFDCTGLEKLFGHISLNVLLRWLFRLPALISQTRKALRSSEAALLAPIRFKLLTDTLIHVCWLMQLEQVFRKAGYRKLLVDWDRHKLQALLVLAGRRAGMETITFVHGAIYTPEKFVPLIADTCLAWGEGHVHFFTALGEEPGRLLIAGNTRFQTVLPERQMVMQQYGIEPGLPILLHASQNFPDLEDHVIVENIHREITSNGQFRLAVKFHPSQDNRALISRISHLPGLILLDQRISAREALALAECALIVSSTFTIDAMIAGVPVLLYKAPGVPLRGIAVELSAEAEVPVLETTGQFQAMLSCLSEKGPGNCIPLHQQQAFIQRYCAYYDKEAAGIIAAHLV